VQFPNLKVLSVMRNPGVPDMLQESELAEYQEFRKLAASKLIHLDFLDCSPIDSCDRNVSQIIPVPSSPKSQSSSPLRLSRSPWSQSPKRSQKFKVSNARVRYDGKNSEGNRFILNKDL